MSSRVVRFSIVVTCAALLAGWGCSWGGPSRVKPPSIDASAAGTAAVKQYDTDGDGLIGGAELDKAPALKSAIKNLDTIAPDGKVSADEVTARIESWQKDKLGKMSLNCKVTRRGRPLEGATVTFVPEEFLGDQMPTATGVTGAGGWAVISVPLDPDKPNDPPGLPPGLYRVQVTHEKMKVSPKFNTQTTLGVEVAQDNIQIQQGLVFDVN